MEETSLFFERPILNSPYEEPRRHWELGDDGQPTHKIIETRRQAKFVTPIPAPRKQEGRGVQQSLLSEEQEYDPTPIINDLRAHVDAWRRLPNSSDWSVTPETARLLEHWRHYKFNNQRPFFCQIEAVETAIWLVEVAPKRGEVGKRFIKQIEDANREANPELLRMAFKLATGAGKTTVMAMLIAWQTLNSFRRPGSPNFARGFLIVAPGLTIKERLRVLQPNDPENYYQHREIVPSDLLLEMRRAQIVITNYHAFKLRERIELSKGTRALLEGRGGSIKTLETEGQMLQRVMPELMSMKNILVINDEAHHCYRHKVVDEETGGKKKLKLDADEKEEMRKNREAARLWISGLEIVKRKLGVSRVVDLSATPFFLAGSGYREGTLFPWTMSDFSLMDAIESGIVKLPRVPVSDNIPGEAVPRFRNLWEHIRAQMPRKGVSKAGVLDPLSIPQDLKTALDALYGHYEKTFAKWQEAGSEVPPCFIVVCNNTSSSKLVYDYISGFYRKQEDGTERLTSGRLALFRNFDEYDSKLARPRTLLIDSEQLESGEALDDNFRSAAADEIERFRREMVERSGNQIKAEDIDDVAILREAMNTVGRKGQLGESIRCIVSVSMLTEGWDANTVTHVLGVRAFGTQLLCEQVMGRLLKAGRVYASKNSLAYIRAVRDFPAAAFHHNWTDTVISGSALEKRYVVETSPLVIQRCILMTTDPGDLVLDPTCGSGTTAYVSEQWGRRWITIDTSRVALALARARIMGARYPYYLLADTPEGQQKEAEVQGRAPSTAATHGSIRQGFVYERVPHITLKSIANNAEIDVIWEEHQKILEPLREQLNRTLKQTWEEWQIPREANEAWPDTAKKLHEAWWQARIARQRAIDGSIASKAEFEYLYDKPYEDKKKVRVAGPFTVESLSPHRVLALDENDKMVGASTAVAGLGVDADEDDPANFVFAILENLRTSGVQQAHKQDKIEFTSIELWPGQMICAQGRYADDKGVERRAGIMIGPEFGTVTREDLVQAAREAGDAAFDVLIACAFNYDAHSSEFNKLGRIAVLKARMNADLHMAGELKNTGKGNLFVIFGEPDITILHLEGGQIQVRINGVDVFDPSTGEVRSDDADGIACWLVDTDYNEESFFVRQAYFLGANDPYKALKTTLKAEIDEDAWATLHSDTSRPFDKPASGRIAVKVINHLGDEVMKIFRVK